MEKYRIDEADIILEDLGEGKGKIIIAAAYGYNFSYYWGSMGSSLKEFLCSINVGYFINKLSDPNDNGVFDGKASVANIRKYIKDDLKYDLPFYKYMEAQKSLRELLKEAEACETQHEFVDAISNIPKSVDTISLNRYDTKEFEEIIESLCSEPWNFISTKDSDKSIFLRRLFPKLQKELRKK